MPSLGPSRITFEELDTVLGPNVSSPQMKALSFDLVFPESVGEDFSTEVHESQCPRTQKGRFDHFPESPLAKSERAHERTN